MAVSFCEPNDCGINDGLDEFDYNEMNIDYLAYFSVQFMIAIIYICHLLCILFENEQSVVEYVDEISGSILTDLQRISVGEVNDNFFSSNLDASAPIFCPTSSVRCVTGFGDFPTNFNLIYSNLQGIFEACHFDEFKLEIAKSKHISCIVIVETWLRRGVNQNKTCDIPGFTLHRSDRHSRKNDRNKGGGVAVYVANGLKVNTVVFFE